MSVPQSKAELKKRNRELAILNRIAEALNREADLQKALHAALSNIADLFNLETGWIFLIDEETGKYYAAATLQLPPALADHPRRLSGSCYCLDTYAAGDMEGAANINAIRCSRLKNLKEGTAGLRYHASIPLYAQGKPLGVLNVASTDWQEIAPDELRLLHTVGDLMGIAIERARLFDRSIEIGAIEERNRIAREIHDTIAQGLSAITLQLETADALLEANADPKRVRHTIQQALQTTRANLAEARCSVTDLRAAPLEGKSLSEALQALVADEELRAQMHTRCEIVGSGPPLPQRLAVELYRIAQEATNNVRQHAGATHLTVSLIRHPERVRLVVEDDGTGFRPDEALRSGRYGLIGLYERVEALGGQLDIASAPGSGTVVEVMIPLDGQR